MAVPNNYNFSLQDVINEIPGGQTSLAECFLEATDALFDPTYEGSKNSLRNFRNYNSFVDTLSISPTTFNAGPGSSTLLVTVTSNTGWSVTDNASWLTTNVPPASGLGDGSFTVTIALNATGSTRNGIVTVTTVGGTSVTLSITQTGIAPQPTFPINLGRNAEQLNACFSPTNIYYLTGNSQFAQATGLYTNSQGTNTAPSNYYADGTIVRFWNGNSFTGITSFCLAGPPGGGGGGFE